VINVGSNEKPSYLPAEVCRVVEGQQIKRKLSGEQTSEMIKFACRSPWENANSIVGDGKGLLGLNPPANAALVSTPGITWRNIANNSRRNLALLAGQA